MAADGDNSWCSDGPVVVGNVARLKAAWKPVAALTGGLKRLASDEAATNVRGGWELSTEGMVSIDGGGTAWPIVSNTRGRTRMVCTAVWLDTTAGCETTTTGDLAWLADWEVDNAFSDDKTRDSDSLMLTAGSIVFFLAISSSNYSKALTQQCQHESYWNLRSYGPKTVKRECRSLEEGKIWQQNASSWTKTYRMLYNEHQKATILLPVTALNAKWFAKFCHQQTCLQWSEH